MSILNKQHRALFSVLPLLFLACPSALAQTSSQGLAPVDLACIHQIETGLTPFTIDGHAPPNMSLAEQMALLKVPGLSIAVIRGGRVAWAKGFGVTGAGGDPVTPMTDVTPETLFQAASISKVITATGILVLVQSGRLDLDADVNRYLTSWKIPENAFTDDHKVTLRELLSHTAGVSDTSYNNLPRPGRPIPTITDVLNGQPPADNAPVTVTSRPGLAWRYSGGGFVVLAEGLQDVSKRPFTEFLKESVLSPLGMNHSEFHRGPIAHATESVAAPHDASGFVIEDGDGASALGDDGLSTTPSDLARWVLSIQAALRGEGGLLTPAMARAMVMPQTTVPWLQTGTAERWGLGVKVGGSAAKPYFGHSGNDEGYRAVVFAYEDGDGAVIMTNGDNGGDLINELLSTLSGVYHWPDFHPVDRKMANLESQQLDRYVGSYETGLYHSVRIQRKGDHLYFGSDMLAPENARDWYAPNGDRFSFTLPKGGPATALILPVWSVPTVAKRVGDAEAERVIKRLAEKVKEQRPDPGSDRALRRLLLDLQRGKLERAKLEEGLAALFQCNMPYIQEPLKAYGKLLKINFQGVSAVGWDLYQAEFQDGDLLFRIGLDADGKVSYLSQRRGTG